MQNNQKTILLVIVLTSIFVSSGCLPGRKAVEVVIHSGPAEIQPASNENVAKRFPESASGPTVVESAVELSDKYAILSEEAAVVRQQNYELISKNKQLEDQLVAFEAQLRQTQKELAEANDILIEMRIELNNWKTDVLGFRNEMRDAETEQLKALLKILEILGGETQAELDQGKDASLQTVSPAKPGQSEP